MFRYHWLAATIAVAAFASPAWAGEHYYFHKAGVSRDMFVAEKRECEELARGGKVPQGYTPPTQNAYAAGAGAFMQGFMRGRQRRALWDNIQRTCKADKGYRRIAVPKSVIVEVNRLDGEARIDRMAEMAGAPEPLGERLPE